MNLPTKITFSRIILVVLLIVALFVLFLIPDLSIGMIEGTKINIAFLIVCVVFLVASLTDWLDGYLARKNNQVTDLGKFLDPIADKLLVNSMVIFLVAPSIFAPYAVGQTASISVWCAIILVGRDIVVDALRFIAAQKNVVIAANIFGKAKTVLQMVAIVIVLLNGFPFTLLETPANSFGWGNLFADIFVYLATFVSLLSGIIYVWQNRHVFKGDK